MVAATLSNTHWRWVQDMYITIAMLVGKRPHKKKNRLPKTVINAVLKLLKA